jgi:ribose transport system substrate-binding protein
MRDKSYKVILDFLNRHPKDKHILIAAANDTSAMGAIAAVRELGREKHVAVVGQDCVEEMLREMQRSNSPAIGSISHEVQLYGPRLIDLGLSLLRGETVPPYNYVEHRAVTPDLASRALEALLLSPGPFAMSASSETPPRAASPKKRISGKKSPQRASAR